MDFHFVLLHCIFTAAYFMFIEDSYAIIIVLFENMFRVTLIKTVLQSMPQLHHFYPSYLPYIFTLPVLDSTQLTSLLDMKGKIVLICHTGACRMSGA